jgi:beta-carotene 3-hydroxylase
MAYMFVHDGLVHRRFPVGPIENVPYFRRVAAAHQVWIPSCSPHLSPSYY